jgi:Fe-S-cluster containining protein
MPSDALPVIDPARTEFGFGRTVCACQECTLNCRHIPGYLIPADLERIQQYLSPSENLLVWACQHLLASPSALVLREGQVVRIPTLVPARRPDGACVFLTDADRCAIHAAAPYGCAFFDSHMSKVEADRRSKRGLQAIIEAWVVCDHYAGLWVMLANAGLVSPPPEVARKHLQRAFGTSRARSVTS